MADTTLQIIGGMFGRECCVVPCTAVATPDSLRTSERTTSCDTGHAVEHREPIPMQAPWRATEPGRRTRLWVNARSAIDTVVDLLRPPHIWLPSYLCPSLVHAACDRLHIEPSFYAIDESLQIADRCWLDHLHRGDLVVFVSYFGFAFDKRDAQAAQERGAAIGRPLPRAGEQGVVARPRGGRSPRDTALDLGLNWTHLSQGLNCHLTLNKIKGTEKSHYLK